MRSVLAKILNLPWTLAGLFAVVLSVPKGFSFHGTPFAIVADVRGFWWYEWLPGEKGVRALTVGNIVLLGQNIEKGDLEHELVHVEQFERRPLIFPFFYWVEKVRYGNRYNKYENEAYTRARNVWIGETKSLQLAKKYLGKEVEVIIDRPLGSTHLKHGFVYEVNYGFIEGAKAPDGEDLDAYYLGVVEPLQRAKGMCIAIAHRKNDDDDKLIVVPHGVEMADEQILSAIHFQEQWFETEIVR